MVLNREITGKIRRRFVSQEDVVRGGMSSRPRGAERTPRVTQHVIHADREFVVVTFGKSLSFADIARYSMLLRANPAFRPTFSEIVDLTEVEEITVEADEFLKLADETDPFSPSAKRAFVAWTSAQNHAARMHKILRAQRNIEIFSTLEEAERWIRD